MTKFYLIKGYLVVLLLFSSLAVWAQSRTITGKVTSSDDGTGLPGVNILEKGTSNGAVTDANGGYAIQVSGSNAVLVFSFVGYATSEVTVGSQTTVDVSLSAYSNEDNAQIRFLATNNGAGNNIYLDNITISVTNGIENLILNNLNLQVAPNPFSGSTKVNFTLLTDAKVKADMYDLLGRKVASVFTGDLGSGVHELTISETHTQDLNDGIYFLRLNVNGVEKSVKLMIRK